MTNKKVLIVGQGLAGTCVAVRLKSAGYEITICDDGNASSASRVAAGIWNPVVVKRFLHAWMAAESVQSAIAFYLSEEERLGESFFHRLALNKLFSNAHEKKDCLRKFRDNALEVFADEEIRESFETSVKASEGALRIREAGYMEVKKYLDLCRESFLREEELQVSSFDYSMLKYNEGEWHYGNGSYSCVFFCEGAAARNNPFLRGLNFKNTKGEILRIKTDLKEKEILNKKIFLLPHGEGEYTLGATFNWDREDTEPSEEAKEELLEGLKQITDTPNIQVMKQVAGVRPALQDRRPLVGFLTHHPQMAVLNALGSRGVLLAPLMSELLCKTLATGQNWIPREADVERISPVKPE